MIKTYKSNKNKIKINALQKINVDRDKINQNKDSDFRKNIFSVWEFLHFFFLRIWIKNVLNSIRMEEKTYNIKENKNSEVLLKSLNVKKT